MSEPNAKKSYTLKLLFFVVAAISIAMAVVTQIGMGKAEFEIVENGLTLNADNLVEGNLRWLYHGTEHEEEPWPFDCSISNISNRNLLKLKKGSKAWVRYRVSELGPLKKQDPYQLYLSRVLGLPKESIVGYAIMDDSTSVIINGDPL